MGIQPGRICGQKVWRWGEEGFIGEVRAALGVKAIGRSSSGGGEQQQLRDSQTPFKAHFDTENSPFSSNLSLKLDIYPDI
jgi:hypothetical protein